MSDFDALLKRSFAEAHEPADNGFSLRVSHAVERREAALKLRNAVQAVGWAVAAGALGYAAYAMTSAFGVDLVSTAGDQIGEVRGVLGQAPAASSGFTDSLIQSASASMTYVLLSVAALAGGAVAYRATQE
jgi:hypothetical protein